MLPRWTWQVTRFQRRSFSLLRELKNRGFIQDVTRSHDLELALGTASRTVYAGIDPTARSLHIGHLLPLLCLFHFRLHGHTIIPLIGGATGRIGDPSGRTTERQLADVQHVEDNKLPNIHHSTSLPPHVMSNLEWHQHFTMLDFLRTVGVHARISAMISRESVKARLDSQQGISFTEFTYQLLQAYDFYHLHKHHGCSIQVGGSDQWGNIVAGLELIAKTAAAGTEAINVFGITTPLLTTSTGEKFGKSAGNAVWLDPGLTSIFDFYQYFIKVTDADVEKYLKMFTLLPLSEIADIVKTHEPQPDKRIAQRRLAAEVTEMVHGREGLIHAETMTKLFFGSDYCTMRADDVIHAFKDDPRLILVDEHDAFHTPLPKLIAKHGLVTSNSAARMLVQARGLYLNNSPVLDVHFMLSRQHLIDNRMAILRAGKDKLLVLALKP
ncbi:hypothetical protein F5887DRAFT_963863 [Amanita rubescens]|nr:hypothetical protein F5887DRAFT_963863 [Amanita rubescens]